PVRLRINRDRLNTHLAARPDNPDCNLAAVGDQYFSNHLLLLPYHKCQFRADNYLSVYVSRRLSHSDRAFALNDLCLQFQRIPREYHSFETAFLDAAEKCDPALMLRHAQDRHRARLRQRLKDQDARHHCLLREMSFEEIFAVCHCLISDCVLPRNIILDLIDQEEGMSVRDDLLDLLYI